MKDFLLRLKPFLAKLPKGQQFVVEVRNKNWLGAELYDVLRQRGVALALIDHPWMPRPAEILAKSDPITADFTYIRWLGDRKGIEEETKSWDKTIVNRRREPTSYARTSFPLLPVSSPRSPPRRATMRPVHEACCGEPYLVCVLTRSRTNTRGSMWPGSRTFRPQLSTVVSVPYAECCT